MQRKNRIEPWTNRTNTYARDIERSQSRSTYLPYLHQLTYNDCNGYVNCLQMNDYSSLCEIAKMFHHFFFFRLFFVLRICWLSDTLEHLLLYSLPWLISFRKCPLTEQEKERERHFSSVGVWFIINQNRLWQVRWQYQQTFFLLLLLSTRQKHLFESRHWVLRWDNYWNIFHDNSQYFDSNWSSALQNKQLIDHHYHHHSRCVLFPCDLTNPSTIRKEVMTKLGKKMIDDQISYVYTAQSC